MALALGIGAVAGLLGVWSMGLLALLIAVAVLLRPALGLVMLAAACALDRFSLSVGGPNVRPDELAALLLAAALILGQILTGRPRARPRVRLPRPAIRARMRWRGRVPGRPAAPSVARVAVPLLAPVLAYWGTNVLSTLASSGDLTRGLGLDILTLDLVVLFVALVAYLNSPARLMWGVWLWLGVATVEAAVGMGAFAWYLAAHHVVPGVQLAPDNARQALVYGTLYEGNIFGSYMSAAFLIALALVTEETVAARHKAYLYFVCVATAVGLLLSDTRSAWGATVVGALVLLALLQIGRGGRRTRFTGRLLGGLAVVAVVLGVALAVLPGSITGTLGARAQGLLNFTSGSGYGRVQLYKEALDEWQAHPVLGLGPGSFNYRLPGDTATGPAWLPNLSLQALHDTGVIGLLVMLWLFVAYFVVTLRALRRAPPGQPRAALAGLIAAVTALLIAFQLTPGFSLGYSWALIGFGIAAARVASSHLHSTTSDPLALPEGRLLVPLSRARERGAGPSIPRLGIGWTGTGRNRLDRDRPQPVGGQSAKRSWSGVSPQSEAGGSVSHGVGGEG